MKKYSVAVCVCAVLFSVGIHGGGMREVSARAPGACLLYTSDAADD